MRRLTLLRHAKTEPQHSGQEDWDRVLEPRGLKDAPEMARRLRERKLKPDLVITSPAVRALTTAQIFARELHLPAAKLQQDERLYLASPKVLKEVVRELGGDAHHLMIVGHNPGLTEFADRISEEREVDNMPTCAIYTLEFDLKDWSELEWDSGVNAEFDYPKNCSSC
ncbi:MAG TPA: histidine phosphatase family protein [Steroidobacter sp.]|uniref:SixA phosphatase family protein n=1 Tax=Steroidobacter sp. TaxID=1978227 RepID=UPI002ED8BB8B